MGRNQMLPTYLFRAYNRIGLLNAKQIMGTGNACKELK